MTQARPHLKRAISGVGFFALAFGSMIGVGWITTLNQWFLKAGPGGAIIGELACFVTRKPTRRWEEEIVKYVSE